MPSEPSELERLLAALDLRARNMLNDERQKEYADAARLLRAMAADLHASLDAHEDDAGGINQEWVKRVRRRWKL